VRITRHGYQRCPHKVLFHCDFEAPLDSLSLSRQFTIESGARAIEACDDPAELRRIAQMLLSAWQLQSDLTRHYGALSLGMPSHP